MSTGLRRTTWQRPPRSTTPMVDGMLRGAVRELVTSRGSRQRKAQRQPAYRRELRPSVQSAGLYLD